jgi:hypothetical protein
MRTRNIAAGIGAAVLLTIPIGQVGQAAWADTPQQGTTMQHDSDSSSDRSSDRSSEREERARNDKANNRDYDNSEYRGDDKSSKNSDQRIIDVNLLNTSPNKKNGDDDHK